MRVMWQYVELRGMTQDELGQFWVTEIGQHEHRHGPFRRRIVRHPSTWNIKVLSYAIANCADVGTTQISREALRLMTNMPICLQIDNVTCARLRDQLSQAYVTLLGDNSADFRQELAAIGRKNTYYNQYLICTLLLKCPIPTPICHVYSVLLQRQFRY